MAKILSVEVGYSVTRICEMDYRAKNPKVYKYVSIPTPQGVMDDGFLTGNEEFVMEFKKALAEKKIKTKQAVFSVTSSKIATREVFLPAVKMNQVDALVKANASDYFPIDLTEYELASLVLGVHKEEGQSDRYKVLVMAAEKKLVRGYENLAETLGLHLMSLDYSGNSIYQIMRNECKEDTEMVLKVEEHSTIATIIQGQNLVLQRNLAYGVEEAIQMLMRSTAFEENSYADALKLMKRKTCIKNVLSDNTKVIEAEDAVDESVNITVAKKEITAAFTPLINNVMRVVDLYQSKNQDHPIKKVRMVGLGSDISGLTKLFTNELGISTAVLNDFTSVTWNRAEGEGNPGRYIAAIGTAIAPVGFVNEEKQKSDLQNVNYRNVAVLSAILFVVLSAALAVMGITGYNDAKEEEARLLELQTKYEEAEEVYNTYNNMVAFYNQVKTGYLMTEHPNDNLLAFLQELEEKLPADAEVTDFSSDSTQAMLTMKVTSKEEAAKVIQTLRGFDCIMDVSIGAVDKDDAEENAEDEDPRVRFCIVCTYYPSIVAENGAAGTVPTTAE